MSACAFRAQQLKADPWTSRLGSVERKSEVVGLPHGSAKAAQSPCEERSTQRAFGRLDSHRDRRHDNVSAHCSVL